MRLAISVLREFFLLNASMLVLTVYHISEYCSMLTPLSIFPIIFLSLGGALTTYSYLLQPLSMVLPGVVGFKLNGKLRTGVTATDLVLTITQILRKHGVVGKFVEFYGI